MRRVYFEEEQRWDQPWIRIPILAFGFASTVLFLYLAYWSLLKGEMLTQSSHTDKGLIFTSGMMAITLWIIYAVLAVSRMFVKITDEGITYRFTPYASGKTIYKNDISDYSIRKYNAWKEFAGYGVKKGKRKNEEAFIVSGDTCLQVRLKGGKTVLFGTQRPDFLRTALKKMDERSHTELNGRL